LPEFDCCYLIKELQKPNPNIGNFANATPIVAFQPMTPQNVDIQFDIFHGYHDLEVRIIEHKVMENIGGFLSGAL